MNIKHKTEQQLTALAADGTHPRLLLHSCCGPCATAVLEQLLPYTAVTVYFCNPNIRPEAEYQRRLENNRRVAAHFDVPFLNAPYDPQSFTHAAAGIADTAEGGTRCDHCIKLRLAETAKLARAKTFDLFATTLTVSPHKNAPRINQIGKTLAATFGITHLCSDFKKQNGYHRSIVLSQELGLYRQNYCGCQTG